jgi:hypothetical protein
MLKSTNVGIVAAVDICSVCISAKLRAHMSEFTEPDQSVSQILVSNIRSLVLINLYITEE